MKSLREWQFIVLSILAIAKALDYDERKERYSSSVLGLMKLYELEQQYIKTLQVYAVERNNSILTKYLSSIELNNVNKKSYREREEHVSNILNAFTLIRRTHQDWPKWQKFMKTILNASEMVKLNAIVSQAPDKQDMKEMLENMQRAEKINNLHAIDKFDGNLSKEMTSYHLGCRGLFLPPGKLVCRYNFTTSPFLRLAPLKQEEINLDPYIVVYHDVLHDREIAQMKEEMANAHISNAWIEERKANQSQMRQVIGRVSWLTDSSNFMDSVNQRIMDMTGFSMKGIESLQVCNYGPGCNFKPHYDYMAEGYEPPNILTLGDRLASVIFYASEVHLGGATVFPRLDVAITPKKGAGLVWYNTYDDSTHDQRSQHAVCPTLMGSRWTLTKWVHLSPQMFLKPCRPRK
ncbi:uncharacterized protein Dwil_GK11220 [Drosophila willistoni]|uniref:procollagen-proline 4-dioxygenase n=1 Tax=Drosophila willistoni TaxID=7260 RepID=B4N445_DROWI|nr:uncharacterized protein Dwil_GK11220 [Drosophila willistoni]